MTHSVRLGNNRFGQPGAWQVSFFRDTIAPRSGFGGGYANGAIGTASSAPVFSNAAPAGTPRCVFSSKQTKTKKSGEACVPYTDTSQ